MKVRSRVVKQANLTAECWSVQVWGLEYCKKCEHRNTKECGGQKIRKTGRNSKGIKVPIP